MLLSTVSKRGSQRTAGLTWVEALVALAILTVLGVFVAATLRSVTSALGHSPSSPVIYNMRRLWLCTDFMAVDGVTNGDKSLGWPGDTGGTFRHWVRSLVPNYLSTNDIGNLLSAPGKTIPRGSVPEDMAESAILVHAVSSNSSPSAVFLTSANFTNTPTGGVALLKSARPLGDSCFVVFRKGGDGAILNGRQVGKTNLIGSYVPLVK